MKPVFKLVTLTTAVLLGLACADPSGAAPASFADLKGSAVQDKIIALQQKGILQGVGNDQYSPSAPTTGAQAVQMLVNAFDLNIDLLRFIKAPQATDYYPKANNKAWYADALIIAANHDMGLEADFDPARNWSREEFARRLMLTMEQNNNLPMIKIIPVEIADSEQFSNEENGPIQRALVLGIAKLDAEGRFHPAEAITRADAAEMLYNALVYAEKHRVPGAGKLEP